MSQDRLADWIVTKSADVFKYRSDRLLCANVDVNTRKTCRNDGTKTCSNCKLVSYCSQACQKKHWPIHKRDCKDPLLTNDWRPVWERENRSPAWMDDNNASDAQGPSPFMLGLHLWGNIPAIDLVNLDNNEKDHSVDFSLACVASGDLRNVVRTVNALPDDYSGRLTIVLNDRDHVVVMRNLALICTLGTIEDEVVAAELALHFWYSVFLPIEYNLRILVILRPLMEQLLLTPSSCKIRLGSSSSMSCDVPHELGRLMVTMLKSTYSMLDANKIYKRIRCAPSRNDYYDRAYCNVEPAHRVSLQDFRLFGLVLPFGALNAHFNVPNRSLFSPSGSWLLNDHVTPLESWDLKSVIETGKLHGAQRAEIFGCLYFFLTDQLRTFARRLRQFSISFHLYSEDARDLAGRMKAGGRVHSGVPPSVHFDRIEVSNIMDAEYVGISRVLTDWAPLLKNNRTATIIAYFMNWRARQKGADLFTAGKHVMDRIMDRLHQDNRVRPAVLSWWKCRIFLHLPLDMLRGDARSRMMLQYMKSAEPVYDNWAAFNMFLKSQRIDEILRRMEVRMKERHTIVPHRCFSPLDGPGNALPVFPDDESWYLNVYLGTLAWSERYVEFSRK
ncbi:hypothetical protein NEOLEDRAFT_1068587 [Neolentinus lepideus HHB14362 ss-1]|uniref:MYND-type domain-containing protein n=1 Tax=Neolentinus lepideus HHB14362 ss-1 TaxID=1314782 RepID=A0A165RJ87_9AGAM|nr:hypothetical protein NEOLEDRAFT_1068587 [Neolentinus lepideus HHB14362 ss-1]